MKRLPLEGDLPAAGRPRGGVKRAAAALAFSTLIATVFLLFPSDAQAKFILINTGAEIFEVGDLPYELQADAPSDNWKLGYMCSRLGIFFADIWTWDCRLVAYEGDTYADLPPETQADLETMYPMSEARRGIWNEYGVWAFVGLFGLGVLFSNSDDEEG
jgi:hypothetical protein